MKSIVKYILYLSVIMAATACNDDNIRAPYRPVTLPKISRLNIISGSDSSVFIYNTDMILTSGRDNSEGNSAWKESFAMEYQNSLLTGATYEYLMDERKQTRNISYKRNDFNMLSTIVSETWTKGLSLSYDESYRLIQIYMKDGSTENLYVITYNGPNVATVELHQISENGGESDTRTEYTAYDSNANPFHFLVNVFHAPAFASAYGPVRYDSLPLGMLLSANNPTASVSYVKNGEHWENNGTPVDYMYEYADNDPVTISGGGVSLVIEYH
ncbi:MAG: hypothetical protein LBL04_06685 [Bacteroidales bacterium]|jgi:hypothetical protein|nr:hypothetical protein [Bacteroidales bacterium]